MTNLSEQDREALGVDCGHCKASGVLACGNATQRCAIRQNESDLEAMEADGHSYWCGVNWTSAESCDCARGARRERLAGIVRRARAEAWDEGYTIGNRRAQEDLCGNCRHSRTTRALACHCGCHGVRGGGA